MPPLLSIIIPTYRRPQILRRTLDHIEIQTVRDQLEVIVVSDGPDSKTAEMIQNLSWSFPLQYFSIPKSQQGAARNAGIQKAGGKYVLFIGDDIFLQKDACEKHLESHTLRLASLAQGESFATLGFTTWDPAVGITPVMRWLEKTGWQFGYSKIKKYAGDFLPPSIQHRYTYASHISLPWKIVHRIPFREDIPLYGWEDTEWGMRLRNAGIRLLYQPETYALHHHRMELKDSLTRMEMIGASLRHTKTIIPVFDRAPRGLKRFAYRIMSFLPTIRGKHYKAFLNGMCDDQTPLVEQ